jgi:hypothetical protein
MEASPHGPDRYRSQLQDKQNTSASANAVVTGIFAFCVNYSNPVKMV